LIFGEIKIGQCTVAGGTHQGAVVQERRSSAAKGRKCQWGFVIEGRSTQWWRSDDVIAALANIEVLALSLDHNSRYQRTPASTPHSTLSCLDDMAVNGDAESQAINRDELRQKLITSSTKRRINELSGLQHKVADDCECAR
jgi:hypothetical protein